MISLSRTLTTLLRRLTGREARVGEEKNVARTKGPRSRQRSSTRKYRPVFGGSDGFLEDRMTPAVAGQLAMIGSSLVYAGGNNTNLITISTPGVGQISITDSTGTITTTVAGFTGSGTNTVTGTIPVNAFTVILNGNGGFDTISTSGALNLPRNVQFLGEQITLNNVINTTGAVSGSSVTLGGNVQVAAGAPAALISTTTAAGGSLSVTGTFTTPNALTVNTGANGNVTFSNNLTVSGGALSVTGCNLSFRTTQVSGGAVTLSASNAVTLNDNFNASGTIAISANTDNVGGQGFSQTGGNLSTSSTASPAINLRVNNIGGSGNAAVRGVLAGNGAGITINTTAGGMGGAITDANGTALNVYTGSGTLTALSDKGISLDTTVATLTNATAATSGAVNIRNGTSIGLTVTAASANSGAVQISNVAGSLTLASNAITALGGNVTLTTTTAGDVILNSNSINAGTNNVTLTSAGNINDGATAVTVVTANLLTMTATTGGIAAGAQLNTNVNTVSANSANGDINILDADSLTVSLAKTVTTGGIFINTPAAADLTVAGDVTTLVGDIALTSLRDMTVSSGAIKTFGASNITLNVDRDLTISGSVSLVSGANLDYNGFTTTAKTWELYGISTATGNISATTSPAAVDAAVLVKLRPSLTNMIGIAGDLASLNNTLQIKLDGATGSPAIPAAGFGSITFTGPPAYLAVNYVDFANVSYIP